MGLFVFATLSWSSSTQDNAASVLQDRLNALDSMKARFKQVVRADNREISRSRGNMALKRPGKFRWDTKSPMEQLVIADGKQLWIYDVELEQVTVKKQGKGIGGTPALFLSGVDNNVSRDFEVQSKQQGNKEIFYLKARSSQENFQKIQMIYQKQDLVGLVLFDQLGQQTNVQLSRIRKNPSLPSRMFHFKPPRGVDVVRQ
jgi:outer membrane lipoprotein carrier protein